MCDDQGDRLFAICNEVTAELERRGQEFSCIAGSSILLRVLRSLGYADAYPLTVRVHLFNPPFKAWMDKHGPPDDEESLEACYATGAMRIIVGKGPEGMEVDDSQWQGHLAVIVPNVFGDRHALLDLTIVQGTRRDWGVVLPPMCLKVRDEFLKGTDSFLSEIAGCLFIYEVILDDHSYAETPAWLVTQGLDGAANAVIERLSHVGTIPA